MIRDWSAQWHRLSRLAALPFLVLLVSCGDVGGSPNADTAAPASLGPAPAASGSATTSGPDAPTPPASADPTVTTAPIGARCTIGDLTVSLGAATTVAPGQYRLPVILTNRSTWPCSLSGFAGLLLAAGDGSGYDLPRASSVAPTRLVLQPGTAAHANLTYLAPERGNTDVFTPTHLIVTPPGSVNAITVEWPHGPVVDQQAATRAGTFITAVAPGTGGG